MAPFGVRLKPFTCGTSRQVDNRRDVTILDTLAAAYASTGRFPMPCD